MGVLNMITEEADDARVSQKSKNKEKEGKDGTKEGTFAFLKNISVEPCSFLFSLAFSLVSVQVSTLYIQKSCKVGSYFFGNQTFDDEICDNLFNGSFADEQKIVQTVTAKVEIGTQIIKTVPMVILSLFLGPWSDTAGRKMLIMVPFVGYVLYCIFFIINVYFFDALKVEFLWL